MWMQYWPSFCHSSADRCHWALSASNAKYPSEHEATLKGREARHILCCDWPENDVRKMAKKEVKPI